MSAADFCMFGDCRDSMRQLIAESVKVQMCVTSPPYFGLRDYGTASWEGGDPECDHVSHEIRTGKGMAALGEKYRGGGIKASESKPITFRNVCGKCGARSIDKQLGLESTPQEYVSNMVEVFRLVRDLLADDGTLWLNLGDSYASSGGKGKAQTSLANAGANSPEAMLKCMAARSESYAERPNTIGNGIKPKDLIGIPWAVATALRDPYYSGRIPQERDRTWLAAMLDGEGTICGFHHIRADDGSPRTGIHITITNSNIQLLDEANRIWPTSRSDHGRPGPGHLGKRATFRWLVHGADNKMMFLREIYPYLIAKKRQAIVAYNLLLMMPDAKKNGHSSDRDAFREKRKGLTDLLSDLNQGKNVDLPSWLVAPPSVLKPGWYLRQEIIWSKKNCMPESVTDRCTKSHEQIFLLSKKANYYFDHEAIKEPVKGDWGTRNRADGKYHNEGTGLQPHTGLTKQYEKANKRSVWEVATQPYSEAHFATFPLALIEPCILAGSRPGDIVLDPFLGSGTTAQVAQNLGRRWIGCELNKSNLYLQKARTRQQGFALEVV